MSLNFIKRFLLLTVLLYGTFFCWQTVHGEDITINMNVTSTGGGGNTGVGGIPASTDNPPIITSVTSSSISYTIATVSWTATDDKGFSQALFEYGLTTSYGTSGTVTGSGGNYSTNLTGLATGTLYYYKITVKDTTLQADTETGSFTTLEESQPDTIAPTISNITLAIGMTTTTITWSTDENSTSLINYYLSGNSSNPSTESESSFKTTHSLDINNLLSNSVYYYRIVSQDGVGNNSSTSYVSFTTKKDAISPPDATFKTISTNTAGIVLNWTNPSTIIYPDFAGVKVMRKKDTVSTAHTDGTQVYIGTNQTYTDTNFQYNTKYFYTIFSYDLSLNYSNGVYKSINYVSTSAPLVEICNDGIDNDSDSAIDCNDTDCSSHMSCQAQTEICNDSIDNDGDGQIDCADPDCSAHQSCQATPPTEICNDNIDNDNDGAIDCADSDCAGFSGCKGTPPPPAPTTSPSPSPGPTGSQAYQCEDGSDNDNDGYIDYPDDKGCIDKEDNDEYNPPQTTVPSFIKLSLNKILFFTSNGSIQLTPIDGVVSGLSGYDLIVKVKKSDLLASPSSTILRMEGSKYILKLENDDYFQTKVTFPSLKIVDAFVEIDYGSSQFDYIGFKIEGVAMGNVFSKNDERQKDVVIKLYDNNDKLVSLTSYNQQNPYTTNANGIYGWMVMNGDYYAVAQKYGFYQTKTPLFTINNNIFNRQIDLIARPAKLRDVIDSDENVSTNVINVAKNLGQKTAAISQIAYDKTKESFKETAKTIQETAKKFQEVADNPAVEDVVESIIVPATVGVVAASAIPFITLADLLPFLRLLFLQPLMMLGWNRRRRWGLVYNSLNKMPVDLAIVRLIDAETGRLVQSKVTDKQGRYYFAVDTGKYRIEVKKGSFVFPTNLLKSERSDGRKLDIYHGENIEVSESDSTITANIPLDPSGDHKKPRRLIWEKVGRTFQHVISIVGIIITAISLYISPQWYIAILLVIHILLYYIFREFSKVRNAKSWGIVYDDGDKKPIGRVVARLFNAKFNRLVATQITDRKGRYQFLAGDDKYYVTYEHNKYQPKKVDVDLEGDEKGAVSGDVDMHHK